MIKRLFLVLFAFFISMFVFSWASADTIGSTASGFLTGGPALDSGFIISTTILEAAAQDFTVVILNSSMPIRAYKINLINPNGWVPKHSNQQGAVTDREGVGKLFS